MFERLWVINRIQAINGLEERSITQALKVSVQGELFVKSKFPSPIYSS